MNVVTPEIESTSQMFWAETRNFARGDAVATELLFPQIHDTLPEDIDMLEAQQRTMERLSGAPAIDINFDAAPLQARRVVKRLLAKQS